MSANQMIASGKETQSEIEKKLETPIHGGNASGMFHQSGDIEVVHHHHFQVGSYEKVHVNVLKTGLWLRSELEHVVRNIAHTVAKMHDLVLSMETQHIIDRIGQDRNLPRWAITYDLLENGIESDIPVMISRPDTFVVTDPLGNISAKIIEVNGKCPEAQGWSSAVLRETGIGQFETGENVGSMAMAIREISKQKYHGEATVGIVVHSNDQVKGNEAHAISTEMKMLQNRGEINSAVVADPHDIEERSDGVYVKGKKVDFIWRYLATDDLLYMTSPIGKNGVIKNDDDVVNNALADVGLENLYGTNCFVPVNNDRVKVSGVLWKLMREGHNGEVIVYPDAKAQVVGYKWLLADAYANIPEAQDSLPPTYNLEEVLEKKVKIPMNSVFKLVYGSGGTGVIAGVEDTEAIARLTGHQLEEVIAMQPEARWNMVISHLALEAGSWIVQAGVGIGNFDLIPEAEGNLAPFDFDPWVVRVGDTVAVGPAVTRFKVFSIDTPPNNLRINVVQGGAFGSVAFQYTYDLSGI